MQLGAVGIAYAALLGFGAEVETAPMVIWVLMISSLAVAAVLVRTLKERVDTLVGQLSIAAKTDFLTGLANRRGFSELLSSELSRAHRCGHPVGLLIGDLDHFKAKLLASTIGTVRGRRKGLTHTQP